MDNVVTGTNTVSEALYYYTSSIYFQWTSSSSALNHQASKDKVYADHTVKVLGLIWNTETDTLSFSLEKLSKEIDNNIRKVSKRSVLSLSSKLFDPLGFMEPVTVTVKVKQSHMLPHLYLWANILYIQLAYPGLNRH